MSFINRITFVCNFTQIYVCTCAPGDGVSWNESYWWSKNHLIKWRIVLCHTPNLRWLPSRFWCLPLIEQQTSVLFNSTLMTLRRWLESIWLDEHITSSREHLTFNICVQLPLAIRLICPTVGTILNTSGDFISFRLPKSRPIWLGSCFVALLASPWNPMSLLIPPPLHTRQSAPQLKLFGTILGWLWWMASHLSHSSLL